MAGTNRRSNVSRWTLVLAGGLLIGMSACEHHCKNDSALASQL